MSTAKEQMELGKKSLPGIKKLSKAIDEAIEEIGPIMTVYVLSNALYNPQVLAISTKPQEDFYKVAKPGIDRLARAIKEANNDLGTVVTLFQLELAKSVVIEATAVEAIKSQHPE